MWGVFMLKFDNIIRNLSLEEKIELITNDSYGNKNIPNYELPTFNIATRLNETAENVILPTYNMLGQTWNEKLVEEFASELALNSILHNKHILFGAPTLAKEDNEDRFGAAKYLIGKMSAAFIRGIEAGGAYACADKVNTPLAFDENEYRNDLILASEIAIKEGNPKAIVSEGPSNSNIINEEIRYKGLKICEALESADLIRSINAENHITIAYGLDVKEIITTAIRKYRVASVELHKRVISKATFDSLVRNGEILNEEKIDLVLDSLLNHLIDYLDKLQNPGKLISNDVLKSVADESIILLKNEKILPLDANTKITLVGELANTPVMNSDSISFSYSPLDIFNEAQLNLVNFAYGYHSELNDSTRLIDEAIIECNKTRVAVVYLGADEAYFESNNSLPQNQIDLLRGLYNSEISIIAVVCTTKAIDMEFTDMCGAVILTGPNTNETILSTVEAIAGLLNPSGKLTEGYPYKIDEDGNRSEEIKYPLCHGLSYSPFEYRKFSLKHNGVSFIAENTGLFTGKDVVGLYVSRVDGEDITPKKLRGFVKYKLGSNDYDRFFIPFDDKTFRSYDTQKQCYCVLEGVYKIYIGSSIDDISYETEVKLSGVVDNPNEYSYEITESSTEFEDVANRFVDDNESKEAFYKELRGVSFGKRIAAAIIIYIYLLLMMALTAFLGLDSKNPTIPVAVAGILLFIFTLGFIVYVAKAKKHKKKFDKLLTKSPINDMVNELKSFDINSNEQYEIVNKPIEEELAELSESLEETEEIFEEEAEEVALEDSNQEIEEEVIEEIEEEAEYIECDFELKTDELQYSTNLDFQALCQGFNSFALKNGLIVEQSSIRLLISSILSSKLVFVRSTRMDLLPKLANLVSRYLSSEEFSYDANSIQGDSLIWNFEDGKFSQTEFARYIYQAKHYNKRFNMITLNNVDVNVMLNYFGEYYSYCNNPNETHVISIGKNEIELPKNLMFIAIPNSYTYLDFIPNELALYSSSIELQVRENEIIPEEDVNVTYYDYSTYCDYIRHQKEEHYLTEDLWKKLDDFEEALDNESKFRIENKTILQIENLATIALLSGSDITEVLDFVLASKIVPIIKTYKPYVEGATENIVTKSIERYFEMDTIPNTLRALKKAD